jgi:hypothetical protein
MSDPVTVHHQMKSHFDFLRAQPAVARLPVTPAVIIHIFLNRLFFIWGAGEDWTFLLFVTASIDPGPSSHKIK